MFRGHSTTELIPMSATAAAIAVALVVVNLVFNIIANAGFRESAMSVDLRGFLSWQVVGNLAGLATVLTLTALLRFVPLHVAFPITTGLAVVGVQIVASYAIFHESISRADWLGAGLIVVGILLIGR